MKMYLNLDEIPGLKFKSHHLSGYVIRPWSCGEDFPQNPWLTRQLSIQISQGAYAHVRIVLTQ